ncbi:MAG: hypothetical protein GY913_19630 [Proteobacteria bacterium]|nr:hypothetical protein [Pseudomonadota bacterium]MCP4919121.1 hypothetical protein [Pseudomonadota bacterium]
MLGLLLACAPTDTERFVEAGLALDLASGHAACAGIADEELRGECAAHVVREHGATDGDLARTTCALGSASWADECVFLLAEELHDPSDPQATATLCQEAGRYSTSCLMHVWSGHAAALKRELGPNEAADAFAPALDWAGPLASEDLARRGWGLFYRTELDVSVPLDVGACAGLPDPHPRHCRQGLHEALARTIHRVSRESPGAFAQACAAEESTSRAEAIQRAAGVTYVPSPALDAVAKRAIAADCRLEREAAGSEE